MDGEAAPPPAQGHMQSFCGTAVARSLPENPWVQVLTSVRQACSQTHDQIHNHCSAKTSLQTLLPGVGPGSLVPWHPTQRPQQQGQATALHSGEAVFGHQLIYSFLARTQFLSFVVCLPDK